MEPVFGWWIFAVCQLQDLCDAHRDLQSYAITYVTEKQVIIQWG